MPETKPDTGADYLIAAAALLAVLVVSVFLVRMGIKAEEPVVQTPPAIATLGNREPDPNFWIRDLCAKRHADSDFAYISMPAGSGSGEIVLHCHRKAGSRGAIGFIQTNDYIATWVPAH